MCSVVSKGTDGELDIFSNMLISTYLVKALFCDFEHEFRALETAVVLKPKRQLPRPPLPLECWTGYEAPKGVKKSGRLVDS
jgi:hypothetical protein